MPFTLAHPAAVLPFLGRSRAQSWKASLVMGAMVPDLWFLLPGIATRQISHGRYGILVDPPAALLLAWIVVRWILPRLSHLPGLEPLDRNEPFLWGIGYLGAAIGVATHLVWDQFTHSGSLVLSDPIYSNTILFQHGSVKLELGMGIWYLNSLAGMLVLVLWIRHRLRKIPEGSRIFLSRQWIAVALGFLIPMGSVMAWLGDSSLSGPGGMRRMVHMGTEMRMAGFAAILCALAVGLVASGWNGPQPVGHGPFGKVDEG